MALTIFRYVSIRLRQNMCGTSGGTNLKIPNLYEARTSAYPNFDLSDSLIKIWDLTWTSETDLDGDNFDKRGLKFTEKCAIFLQTNCIFQPTRIETIYEQPIQM